MTLHELERWLREEEEEALEQLWTEANRIRREYVGDAVHLRGLIEISNHCARECAYCGVRGPNTHVKRYRMTESEIMESVSKAVDFGYGTVVMQSGEDYGMPMPWLADIIRRIKAESSLAVTLSLGERSEAELRLLREAGADRYLLRFESSNPALYAKIHPARAGGYQDRMAVLKVLAELGYEVGSGVLIGIPGQRYTDLARDILLFRDLNLDMIGVGPFLPHPDTPLGRGEGFAPAPEFEQVPNTELSACKAVALARIVCPKSNIPSTTALATVNSRDGRAHGLSRGANIIMPNLTPERYRVLYEIYPQKAGSREDAQASDEKAKVSLAALGRPLGQGRGDAPNFSQNLL